MTAKPSLREAITEILGEYDFVVWANAGSSDTVIESKRSEATDQILSIVIKELEGRLPERRVNHDRCTWIDNGRCMAHHVKLSDKEIGVIFYENEYRNQVKSILKEMGS